MIRLTSLGICIGATTISAVKIVNKGNGKKEISEVYLNPHNGNPRDAVAEALSSFDMKNGIRVAVTGRKFRHFLNLSSISEPEAVETALSNVNSKFEKLNAVVSAGGENFLVYVIGADGKICSIQTGNKCASGTGDFYVQQLRRMGITLDEAVEFECHEKPYKVSGRCSVFCKSDCTHALNKGIEKERIASGLCRMMSGKVLEILRRLPKRNIMVIGGTSRNKIMMEYLRSEIANLIIPEEAPYFEALGAGYWALENETIPFRADRIFKRESRTFSYLPPLRDSENLVDFRFALNEKESGNADCIIGLDVGSTTTKAVVMRMSDDRVLASVYLRTNGDPIRASRACYQELECQLMQAKEKRNIIGLGVTGSGRQIAGLHAMTSGVINEIIAHASAASYYDPEVDTILEIGGQDAKYTFLVNGVPTDYAMNDACSAGTGSFLEEAAKESLGIKTEQIAGKALTGENPPNFNDQCAAFISSDIKSAFHEGIQKEDIIAGLVYSIAMNYNSRVRGNRPVGRKIFMQGGVCYNKAVPMAMAALTGNRIIVPPDPGLLGAFGVALEVKRRMQLGLIRPSLFSISELKKREIVYEEPFVCNGGKEKCDRKCEIARIRLEGKVYPFGGACNRWYNIRSDVKIDSEQLNYVASFERLVFQKYVDNRQSSGIPGSDSESVPKNASTIGINKSFLTNLFYPLYYHFFTNLGFKVKLAELAEQEGMDYKGAPFCYPAEIAHGYLFNLLKFEPQYLFIPHVKGLQLQEGQKRSTTCPVCQAEPYYLKSAFKKHPVFRKILDEKKLIETVLDFSEGLGSAQKSFTSISRSLKVSSSRAKKAYAKAISVQHEVFREMKREGTRFLEYLDRNPDGFGIVLLGRTYNAYVPEMHMGIPHKFASRGIPVVPCDFLPIEGKELEQQMYWSSGQSILKGASFIADNPRLFGCYITNFSCGPDSFLVGNVRDKMGRKPFLILELDSHVADAGLETRIEAFIDIIKNYRELERLGGLNENKGEQDFESAYFDENKRKFVDSRGRNYALVDPHVHLVFPSMGRLINESGAAVFRGMGIRSTALPPSDLNVLKIGRANTSCKECLPLQLTTGTLLNYLQNRTDEDELVLYFMPTASGPCRFGQYSSFMNDLIRRQKLRDVALMSLSAENSYLDIGTSQGITRNIFTGIILADIMQDIYSVILANAVDLKDARDRFEAGWDRIIRLLEKNIPFKDLIPILKKIAQDLSCIKVHRKLEATPTVLLSGEIFVRNDNLSRQFIVEKLAENGFATKVASLVEWIYYTDWCCLKGLGRESESLKKRFSIYLRSLFMRRYEHILKKTLAGSGLYFYRMEDVDTIIRHIGHLINPELTGEAVLTVGASLHDILEHYCGVIAIGPFGCMPNRIAEAVLAMEMNREGKIATGKKGIHEMSKFKDLQELPFLAIESDGNAFPLIITAKLESFMLQARRVHREMQRIRGLGNGES